MYEKFNTIEEKERESFGRNIEIRACFLRHGSKDPETWHLTEEGVTASEEYGKQFAPSADGNQYIIKAYTSEIERAQKTAKSIIKKVNTNRKGRTHIRLELGKENEDIKMSTSALSLPYSEYKEESRRKEETGKKTSSLHQLAQRVAGQIEHFIEMSKRFRSGSRVDLINITHLPWLVSFIKEAVGQDLEKEENEDKRQKIESKISDLGYLDGFELIIKRDGNNVEISLKIGDSEFVLTEKIIENILNN